MLILKATKSHFKGSYDKQNLVVISYEIYETPSFKISRVNCNQKLRRNIVEDQVQSEVIDKSEKIPMYCWVDRESFPVAR